MSTRIKPIIIEKILILLAILWWILATPGKAKAQPYIDLLNISYFNSPSNAAIGKDKNPTRIDYLNISTTIPFLFKNKQDALIMSPFFERWNAQVKSVDDYSEYHYSIALPFTLLKTFAHSKWTVLTTAILRLNDASINFYGKWQLGGALVVAHSVNSNLSYKLGIYMNSEFYGLFAVPLVGIDWRINDRTNLFGILPASLTLEHKLTNLFFTGVVFRSLGNSYYDAGPKYMRIDENQLGLFLDYYPAKKLLLNIEVGHSILRKLRGGEWHQINNNWNADNNLYFKLAIAYRFRLRS